ncbi:hypothetical protein [Alkalihalobacillus sp. 1P02AB]|uniref:hypothetical protein n=1 Tax=Alkalihalobacillus sp. 1P02AB TaxID=3132260 RepID=UPI0039A57358
MRNLLHLFFFLFILVGCSTQTFDNEDTIALLNDNEIRAEDVLKVYPLEEDFIIRYLQDEIVIHEAKELGIKITDEEIEKLKNTIFPGYDTLEVHEFLEVIGNEEFIKYQASRLGVSEEEYFDIWFNETHKRSAYIDEYIEQKFGEPPFDEFDEWAEKVEEHLDKLFNDYQTNEKLIVLFR